MRTLAEAVELFQPPTHQWTSARANLALVNLALYDATGEIEEVQLAVDVLRNVTSVASTDWPDFSTACATLGLALVRRFEALGEISDLNEAIEVIRSVERNRGERGLEFCNFLAHALSRRSEFSDSA
jgi:hypothetical protein